MAINTEHTTLIRVYADKKLKEALSAIASEQGTSLSKLILQAAVDQYLLKKAHLHIPVTTRLVSRLERLEKVLMSLPTTSLVPEPPKQTSQVDPNDPRGRKYRKGASTFKLGNTPVIQVDDEVPLEKLVERLGGDRALKARLCQLGGRDGKLFKGSLPHAQKVAEVTSRLDPEGLPWLPLRPDRLRWTQMTAEDWVRSVLTQG